jgi:metal-responsive CopG/Arc/MetJ family transcriptional regulator
MKAIQVMFDEDLLAQLDADEEVKEKGRSAVLRRATAAYLERRRRALIADGYKNAYAGQEGVGEDFEGWEEVGEWPSE